MGTNTFNYAYDANGNVTDLAYTNGTFAAKYQYDPYGNTISKSGDLADANPFRFSTKYTDPETALLYYGYRYYQPETGRWLERDPMGERGGKNLYAILCNDVVGRIDPLGLMVGTINVTVFKEFRTDSMLYHERGWKFTAAWTPPTGGLWGLPCECKPCKKVVWFQQARWHKSGVITSDQPMHEEWDQAWAEAHAFVGDCTGSTLRNAVMDDEPSIGGVTLIGYTLWTFSAQSYVKCVEGPDAGTIYGRVLWDASWNTIGDVISSTGAVTF